MSRRERFFTLVTAFGLGLLLLLAASMLRADVPSPNQQSYCGGNCQAVCINGCDTGKHYEWREARCHNNSYSDSLGSYCDDGYVCGTGPCGRRGERACNTAGTGCSSCRSGYQYSWERAHCIVKKATPSTNANWMRNLSAYVGNRPLNQIVIPGTHDTGTYMMTGLSRTQARNITEQLNDGIRYLDLRIGILDGTGQVIHHDIDYVGPKVDDVLRDVGTWLASHAGEIVILKMSHFDHATTWKDYTSSDWTDLHNMIQSRLGSYLIDHGSLTARSTYNQITGNGTLARAIIVFKDAAGGNTPSKPWEGATGEHTTGTTDRYWYNRFTGSWADTTSRSTMYSSLNSSVSSWQSYYSSSNNIFVLQLEATPFSSRGWIPMWLAWDTNPVTMRWIKDVWSTQKLNVVQADYYQDSCLVALAQYRNSGNAAYMTSSNCYTSTWPAAASGSTWDARIWPY